MSEISRIIVVQRDNARLYEELQKRYGDQPGTRIIYDRRTGPRRGSAPPPASESAERRRIQRRFPDSDVLVRRGYFVVRARRRGTRPPKPQ